METIFENMKSHIEIYTDGSAKRGVGAWSYVVVLPTGAIHEASGRVQKTDSNRMEFQAAIEALRRVAPGSKVTLYTDSRVLIEKVSQFSDWRVNNWIKKNGSPIRYVEYFRILDTLLCEREIAWNWVKAHSGNRWNERCDELCLLARKGTS